MFNYLKVKIFKKWISARYSATTVLKIIATQGCEFYGYFKVTIILNKKYNLIINKKRYIDFVKT